MPDQQSLSAKGSTFPPQHQDQQPGFEMLMNPLPIYEDQTEQGSHKLQGKVALITGGDSGIGRAVAIAFAKEGADVAIAYLNEHEDAQLTKQRIEQLGKRSLLLAGDIGEESFCQEIVQRVVDHFSRIDILVNNAGEQHPQQQIEMITSDQLLRTFKTNIFAMFYLTKAVLPYMPIGSSIINTASITAYEGHKTLIDYSSTKGAIVTFTRSLALSLADRGIRVNGVAPGPIWTPLIPASFSASEVAQFGSTTPMKRAGQPVDLASTYVYLASASSSYLSGQMLHINGGTIVNG